MRRIIPESAPGRMVAALLATVLLVWLVGEALPAYLTGPDVLAPPSAAHWLGTNDIGQDVFTGLVRAAPVTMGLALVTGALALTLAFVAGSLAAVFPKSAGVVVLRLTDMLEVIPSILILLLVAAWHRPGFLGLVLVLGLTSWHDDVLAVRAILLRETWRENVLIARAMGAGWPYLLRRHVLPAIEPSLAGLFLQNVGQAAMRLAGLAFLGLTDPRLLTWGGMMQDALA